MYPGLTKTKTELLTIIQLVMFGGKKSCAQDLKNTTVTVKRGGGSIILWSCFSSTSTRTLHFLEGKHEWSSVPGHSRGEFNLIVQEIEPEKKTGVSNKTMTPNIQRKSLKKAWFCMV